MKRMVFSFSFLLFVSGINAQITLEECQRKTQENYPLLPLPDQDNKGA